LLKPTRLEQVPLSCVLTVHDLIYELFLSKLIPVVGKLIINEQFGSSGNYLFSENTKKIYLSGIHREDRITVTYPSDIDASLSHGSEPVLATYYL